MAHKLEIDGQEVDVFTTDEVAAREAAARTAAESEWKPKFETAEQEKTRLAGLLEQRSKEFGAARGEFQRLSDEQQSKLTATELALYKNQEMLADRDAKLAEADKKAYESAVDSAIRAKTGGDAALFAKVKEMYALIQLEDVTPEQIATKVAAAFGAIGTTAPDLLAAAGFGGGGFQPPQRDSGRESFADTERGKEIAKALGIMIEPPKQQ